MKMKPCLTQAVAAAVALAAASFDAGASLVFGGSSGGKAATASFDVVGSSLEIVLSNTSQADTLVPSDVLTGVFFNLTGNPALTRISAISDGPTYRGATFVNGTGTVVGGEWGYQSGMSQYAANTGISSSGLGLFGPKDVFPGANLSGPASPGGTGYGLASAGDIAGTGNGGVIGNELTRHAVTFMLGGLASNFSLSDIGHVTFQYGTSLSEPHFASNSVNLVQGSGPGPGPGPRIVPTAIPEPASLGLTVFGLAALLIGRRRRRAFAQTCLGQRCRATASPSSITASA